MKKLLYSAVALATILFASCQQENLEPVAGGSQVTFTVEAPAVMQTKAIGDGLNVNELIYEVWFTPTHGDLENGAQRLYQGRTTLAVDEQTSKNKATLTLDLVNDQKFTVLFWAQVEGTGVYNTNQLNAVTYNGEIVDGAIKNYLANDESLAAFYSVAYVDDAKHVKYVDGVMQGTNGTVKLRRPFAQINLATLNTSQKYNVVMENSTMTLSNVPTTFDVVNSEVSGSVKMEFKSSAVPSNPNKLRGYDDYWYAGMNYVFAGNNTPNINVSYEIQTRLNGGVEATVSNIVPNVPIKENYRTNIIGNLLTSEVDYEIVVDADFYEPDYEDETEDVYHAISSPEDLQHFANLVNSGDEEWTDANFILGTDIDLSSFTLSRSVVASNWMPIGTSEKPFTGTFDGNGYTIKNLTIVEPEAKEGKAYIGFFGYAKDATIKNVTFENVYINIPCLDIDHSQGHIGAVAGSLEGKSLIENVTVKGDITVYATQDANGASRVAVVAGGNSYGNVTMKNVHVIANEGSSLIANNNTGALAGQLQGKIYFENCSSNIDVTVNKFFAGGLIGIAPQDATFKNCHTTGDVAVVAGREGRHNDEYRVGGIAGGWTDGKNNVCTLIECSYTGNVSGKNSDGSVAEPLDYMGYVGRGYTLANCAGSKVIIDGKEFVQKYDDKYGIYSVDGADYISDGLYYNESNKTYVVHNANGLVAVASLLKSGVTVTLGADIDLSGVEFNGLDTFHPEQGNVFDGKGYTVSNWTNESGASDMGFIRNWVGPIKNLTIKNAHLKTSGRSAIIAAKPYGNIENCHVIDCSIEDSYWSCGLIAGLYNAGSVSDCSAINSSVKSNGGTGAIVGVVNESTGTREFTKCVVSNCTVNNTGAYGEVYSGAMVCGMINIENSTVKFTGCKLESNTKNGKYVGDLYYAAGEDITIVVE